MVQQSLGLFSTGKSGLNGKYRVTYTYVPGGVPGCESIPQEHAIPVTIKLVM